VSFDLQLLADDLGYEKAELEVAQELGVFDGGDEEAAVLIDEWLDDPVQFVRDVFGKEPDRWQQKALVACVQNPRVALKACKGPGKSTVLAWFGWWCLTLHVDANGIGLSITADNLKDGLWKELALWYAAAPWIRREFKMSAERITHRERVHTWWLSARSFPKDADSTQQANTLAGLHAKFVFVLADEMSDYPHGVIAAVEGIFANEDSEAHFAGAGNPTRSEGPLYDACTRQKNRYVVIEITGDPDDPDRSPRISLSYAKEAIEQWGRDDPWVMTNILGRFPKVQSDKLLGPDDVVAAEHRDAAPLAYVNEPIIWGLDVARYGSDDSVLRKRQGPIAWREFRFRGLDGPSLANRVSAVILADMRKPNSWRPDYIFVDVTGVGSSPFDCLGLLGWGDVCVAVDFGSSADDERYYNKRTEMWFRMADWVKKVGCLPERSNSLARDLTAPTYAVKLMGKRTCKVLESKEEMRKRGIASPDDGDSLALTFYVEVPVRRNWSPETGSQAVGHARTDHKPFKSRRAS
jgi:phage terminase large subunit